MYKKIRFLINNKIIVLLPQGRITKNASSQVPFIYTNKSYVYTFLNNLT